MDTILIKEANGWPQVSYVKTVTIHSFPYEKCGHAEKVSKSMILDKIMYGLDNISSMGPL